MIIKRLAALFAGASLIALSVPAIATAATTTTDVLPGYTAGWNAATTPGGTVTALLDSTSPLGAGALELKTDASTTASAEFMTTASGAYLGQLTNLSYSTKQVGTASPNAIPGLRLVLDLNDDGTSIKTITYSPALSGTVQSGVWQEWFVLQGRFQADPMFQRRDGSEGFDVYDVLERFPVAKVLSYGLSIGPNTPNADVLADKLVFESGTFVNGEFVTDTKIFNFEAPYSPEDKLDCKDNEWKKMNAPYFSNQGKCVSYANKL